MGIIKSISRAVLFSIIVTLLTMVFTIHITNSMITENTEKEIVKSYMNVYFEKTFKDFSDDELKSLINSYCKTNDTIKIDTRIEDIGILILKCDEIENKNKTELVDIISEKIVNKIYYRNYTCDFISCLKEGDLEIFFTENGKKMLSSFEKILIFLSIFLIGLGTLLYETIGNKLNFVAKSIITSVTPLIIVFFFSIKIIKKMLPENITEVENVIIKILNSQLKFLIYFLIFGVLLYLISFFFNKKEEEE